MKKEYCVKTGVLHKQYLASHSSPIFETILGFISNDLTYFLVLIDFLVLIFMTFWKEVSVLEMNRNKSTVKIPSETSSPNSCGVDEGGGV